MNIDEAGRNNLALRFDHARGFRCFLTDIGNFTVLNADICLHHFFFFVIRIYSVFY